MSTKFLRVLSLLLLLALGACSADQKPRQLPNGYKVWVMNADEIYLSDRNDELLVGPALRTIGVTSAHLVAYCEPADKAYHGNVRTEGYSVIDLATGKITAGLSQQQVGAKLASAGDAMPTMFGFDSYPVVSQ